MHTIRRYANRKLYDTNEKHYVTLLEIGKTVRHGEDVVIVDHVTHQDITAQTLAQVIYVEEALAPRVAVAVLIKAIREGKPSSEVPVSVPVPGTGTAG